MAIEIGNRHTDNIVNGYRDNRNKNGNIYSRWNENDFTRSSFLI